MFFVNFSIRKKSDNVKYLLDCWTVFSFYLTRLYDTDFGLNVWWLEIQRIKCHFAGRIQYRIAVAGRADGPIVPCPTITDISSQPWTDRLYHLPFHRFVQYLVSRP